MSVALKSDNTSLLTHIVAQLLRNTGSLFGPPCKAVVKTKRTLNMSLYNPTKH